MVFEKFLKKNVWIPAGAVLGALVFVLSTCFVWHQPGPDYELHLSMTSDTPTRVQIYIDAGRGVREANSEIQAFWAIGHPQDFVFRLPPRLIRNLRFDPAMQGSELMVHEASIRRRNGSTVREIPLNRIVPANVPTHIEKTEITPDGLRIVIPERANDPIFIISPNETIDLRHSLPVLTVYTLAVVIVFLLLFSFGVITIYLSVIATRKIVHRSASFNGGRSISPQGQQKFFRGLLPLAAFLIILGARLWTIDHYASDLPYMDQWDGEAKDVFIPWHEGDFVWSRDLIAPHNEHRIFFTRLLSLALVTLNGQWDARLQTVVNAFLPAITGSLLVFLLVASSRLEDCLKGFSFTLITAAFALPLGWENVLVGFQNQFFFLCLFSILTIVLWGNGSSPTKPAWWAGLLVAIAALLTVASGLLAASAALAVLGLSILRERFAWPLVKRSIPTFVVGSLIVIGGLMSQVSVPWHEPYRAQNLSDFWFTLIHHLAWPNTLWVSVFFLHWIPLVFLLFFWWRGNLEDGPRFRLSLGIGIWVFLQCLAIGYSRGAGDPTPISRYADILVLGVVANGAALSLLLSARQLPAWFCPWRRPVGTLFGAIVISGLVWQSLHALAIEMPYFRESGKARVMHSANYVASGDKQHLTDKPYLHLPHLYADRIARKLDHPSMRSLLPASVREPVEMIPDRTDHKQTFHNQPLTNFPPPSLPVWSSLDAEDDLRHHEVSMRAKVTKDKRYPYLKFSVAGHFGLSHHDLATIYLVDTQTNQKKVLFSGRRGLCDWDTFYIHAPGESYILVAYAFSSNQCWLTFTQPREVARGSYYAAQLASWSGAVMIPGFFVALLAFGLIRQEAKHAD